MDQEAAVGRQVFRVEQVHAGRVDADEADASLVQEIDQLGGQRGEVFAELVGVGIRVRAKEYPLLRDLDAEASGPIRDPGGASTRITWQVPR